MRGLFPFVIIVGLLVAAFLAYRNWQQEQKRRATLVQWAASSGFSYVAEDDQWCNRWDGSPFGEGDHRRAQNVIAGADKGRQFTGFDYTYQTHSTDAEGHSTTTTHRYVVTAVQLSTYLPRLQVTPESLLTRFGNALGLDDIELESEDFNRKFRVKCGDPKFASDVLTPRTMQALLNLPAHSWRIDGTDVITWSDGELSPASLLEALALLSTVIDGIPSFVWHDHGVGGNA